MLILALSAIALGLVTLALGSRLTWLGAAVGALLGIGILRFLPGVQDGGLWLIIPLGLAIVAALGAGIAKGLIGLVMLAFGALAGGAIVLAVLDLFGLNLGALSWILALVGAVVGAGLFSRMKDWAVIVLAALVGALLTVRGLQMLLPAVQGFVAILIGLLLAGGGIAYHRRS